MDILKFSKGLFYHSIDVSNLTGKTHNHVLRDIEMLCAHITINPAMFSCPYITVRGDGAQVQTPGYNLPPNIFFTLISGYNTRDRMLLMRDWINRECALFSNFSVQNVEIMLNNMGCPMQFSSDTLDKSNVCVNIADILLQTTKYAKPMTSLEIEQELAGLYFDGKEKRHDNILRDIDNQFNTLKENPQPFLTNGTYIKNGRTYDRRIYILPRDHVLCLMTGYLSVERYNVVNRWLAISDVSMPGIGQIEDRILQAGFEIDMIGY